jgi:hypothetical protein
MNPYKDKRVIFYDHGTFIPLAEKLAEDFGEVLYFSPYNSSFPSSSSTFVGKGMPGVTRINNFFDYVDEATFDNTIFVFPDVGDGDIQEHLRKIGKRVFGSGKGEMMELQRDKMKEFMKSLKLDVGKYRVIKGLSKLREYLKENDNKWVKINIFRGDFETFFAENYSMIAEVLDDLAIRLGPKAEVTKFTVEDNLYDTVEAGMDLYSVDGEFPSKCLAGIEIKNASYVAVFKDYDDFPDCLTSFNDAIAPALREMKYRSFFSTEQRVNKQKSYMNDFCARLGSPPSELYIIMYKNISDIIWKAAEGILVDPDVDDKFGAELLIKSLHADTHWMEIKFPPEIKPFIKLRNCCVIDGKYYMVPRKGEIHEIGAIVASGKTLDEAIKKVKEYATKVKSYYIEMDPESLDKAMEEAQKLEELGIKLF